MVKDSFPTNYIHHEELPPFLGVCDQFALEGLSHYMEMALQMTHIGIMHRPSLKPALVIVRCAVLNSAHGILIIRPQVSPYCYKYWWPLGIAKIQFHGVIGREHGVYRSNMKAIAGLLQGTVRSGRSSSDSTPNKIGCLATDICKIASLLPSHHTGTTIASTLKVGPSGSEVNPRIVTRMASGKM